MSDDFNNLIAAIRYSDFAEFKAALAGIPNQAEALAGLDKDGSSLLECALAWAKVPIIDFLLNAKVPVNVVTKDGLNELHFAANQMNHEEMIPVVRRLVELGVDLDQKEKRYGNSALFTLCREASRIGSSEAEVLVVFALGKASSVDDPNKSGFTVRTFLEANGSDAMRAALPPLEEKSAENSENTSAGAGLGGSIVSKNILLGLGRLTWCLKENPAHELDNGWRFFSDIDDDEYLNDSNNLAVCDWSTVVEIEPAVLPIFDLPVGADLCLMQEDDNKFFVDNKTGLKLSFAEFKR